MAGVFRTPCHLISKFNWFGISPDDISGVCVGITFQGKPSANWGRKATSPLRIAGLQRVSRL